MGRYSILLCSAFFIFALINKGAAIKCYVCAGNITEDCGHPQQHSHLAQNCTSEQNACVTEKITILNSTTQIIRGCGDDKSCAVRSDLHDTDCKTCQEDLCNSSPNLIPVMLSSVILFALVRYFF